MASLHHYGALKLEAGQVAHLAFVDGADVVHPAPAMGAGQRAIPRLAPHPKGQKAARLVDLGVVTTVSIRNTGGTDHLSFPAVGLPGFQFIQDPLDYGTITHHSDMDTWDHAIPEDLMQASAVTATMVYQTATRKEMLPRRELPKPE